jgi:TATA-binding protein-associated factor Taf7
MDAKVKIWLRDLFEDEIKDTDSVLDDRRDTLTSCTNPIERAEIRASIARLEEYKKWIKDFKKQTEVA